LPSDYLIRVREGGFYGWPCADIGKHPQAGFANRAPDKVDPPSRPIRCSRRIRRLLISSSVMPTSSRRNTKVTRSSRSRAGGTAPRRPTTKSCACRSRMASPRGTTKLRDGVLGFRRASCRGVGSPRSARCDEGWLSAHSRRYRRHRLARRLQRFTEDAVKGARAKNPLAC
jgi:hypothetical protein